MVAQVLSMLGLGQFGEEEKDVECFSYVAVFNPCNLSTGFSLVLTGLF